MQEVTTTTSCAMDDDYESYLESLRATFASRTAHTTHLFRTDAQELFADFLEALPPHRRQHYTCTACRHFVERYGGLVTIGLDGISTPAIWDPSRVPKFFADAVQALERKVSRASVTGVFLTTWSKWGQPVTGQWHHMALTPPFSLLCRIDRLRTTDQIAAEKVQDYATLTRALAEFPLEIAQQAKTLLESQVLYRSEACLGVAEWFLDLHQRLGATKNERRRDNMVWLAVAGAPAGFCHIRSTMIGTLLGDLASGMPFNHVAGRFAEKMDPMQYQRPTAQPTDGQISQAEKVIATMQSEGALKRRFAKLDDLQSLWTPRVSVPPAKQGGVFDHLKGGVKKQQPIATGVPLVTTWVKFERDVLPKAESIEFLVPRRNENYAAFVTAADANAPPILQWDSPERRNPVSWYMYNDGSSGHAWGLTEGEMCPVVAIVLRPSMWQPGFAHHGRAVHFVLAGAKDLRYRSGAGLFPQLLKSEYHSIRHTLEAHFRANVIAGKEEEMACGVVLEDGGNRGSCGEIFRVTSGGVAQLYNLDRWE